MLRRRTFILPRYRRMIVVTLFMSVIVPVLPVRVVVEGGIAHVLSLRFIRLADDFACPEAGSSQCSKISISMTSRTGPL